MRKNIFIKWAIILLIFVGLIAICLLHWNTVSARPEPLYFSNLPILFR